MSRTKRETKKFVGLFNKPIWDKLQEIKAELGISYDIAVIEHCILAAYSGTRVMPPIYERNLASRTPHEKDPVKKAQKYAEEQDARKKFERQSVNKRGFELTSVLDGKVIDHGNNFYSSEYATYDLSTPHYVNVGKLVVPFENLDEHNIVNQYKASVPYDGDLREIIKKVLSEQG